MNIDGKTYGELFPHLAERPEYAALAALPFGTPVGGGNPFADGPDGRRVRVGFLCPLMAMGGAEAVQVMLARSLPSDRVAVVGVVSLGPVLAAMADGYRGICPVGHGRESARHLAAECDILITWAIDNLAGILTGISPRPKVVSVIHAPVESPWGRTVYGRPDGIDRWVAVSELAIATPSERSRSVPASVIWNAVDEHRLSPTRNPVEARRSWGVPDHSPVIGYIGRLSAEKNAMAMVDLARTLARDPLPYAVPATIVIVGDGHERAAIVAGTAGLDNIRVVGNDPRAGDVLSAFDWLVVPSDYESFGLSLAEGLWMGVPTIATDVGIARLVPGLVRTIPTPPSGPDILAALRADLADFGGTRDRVDHARRWSRERLAPARFVREWADLICSLVPTMATKFARVDACPDRGGVLPVSLQDDCGCKGVELSECRAGKGKTPGRVTLRECLACRSNPDTVGVVTPSPA